MASLYALQQAGQSVWLDGMSRRMVRDGALQRYIDQGVLGVTANPSIVASAITESADYDDEIRRLALAGATEREIYDTIVGDDIRQALALFRPRYETLAGADGYVSLAVEPALAFDTEATIARADALARGLGVPNAMIAVPATVEGIPAIRELTRRGVNVNATLIFSLDQYRAVLDAFMRGLEFCLEDGGDVCRPTSVASCFVSHIDAAVDPLLADLGNRDLRGSIGIATATLAYALHQDTLRLPRWQSLADLGARPQRLLWASTGTRNPAYPDTMYIDNLTGAGTVIALTPATLAAFLDHGVVKPTLTSGVAEAHRRLAVLRTLGIDLAAVTARLVRDGVQQFADADDAIMAHLAEKRVRFAEDRAA
jgi:transaldolase